MFRAFPFAAVLLAAFASGTFLTPAASFAQSRYERHAFPEERSTFRTPLDVWLSGEGWDEDVSSSHVCINGYRWMTRNLEHGNASAADDSVPVRC